VIESHPQEALLIRYADNCASSSERSDVENLLEHDPAAKEFLQQLATTDLPYAEAFERLLPKNPESVPQKVLDAIDEKTVPVPARRLAGSAAMALMLVCGGLAGWAGSTAWQSSQTMSATTATQTPEWVRLVADYHSLYVRETLTASPRESQEQASERLSLLAKREIEVPSLDGFDMQFRRSQMLAIGDKPLIQLTYLPTHDKPVAICLLERSVATGRTTPELIAGKHAAMNYVHWQDAGHEIVVVGEASADLLGEIAQSVQQSLFSS